MYTFCKKKMSKINKDALFSDETSQYRIPMEVNPGDNVTVIFRTAKDNVDGVYLISKGNRLPMKKFATNPLFDYYRLELSVGRNRILYFFEIRSGEEKVFFNKRGVTEDLQAVNSFGIVPGFFTPDWAKGAVMYQIYVDRFRNGDPSNDVMTGEYSYIGEHVEKVEDWDRCPRVMDVRSFYGGDLQGILDKLDYLVDLGIEVIYMNPIFVSPSNHKYDCQDYDYIDPHFTVIKEDGGALLEKGEQDNRRAERYIRRVVNKENLEASNEFFIRFVEEVHKRGIRILLDGVFNHCGSFNKWLDRERLYETNGGYVEGAYVSETSPYREFFRFHNEHEWPYNEFYDGWWGHHTLPKLAYEGSPELREYIMRIGQKWVSPPYSVDGWRLDVAADLGLTSEYNHDFWKEFRSSVKEVNSEAVIYAEHYGDAYAWLKGDEWDSVMNYDSFMEPLTWFLTGMEKHSEYFREDLLNNEKALLETLSANIRTFYGPSFLIAMNQLSNHDHSRFLTRTNHMEGRLGSLSSEDAAAGISKAVFREAVALQMTWSGAPTLYYGDEAGLCGFTDPDNRRTYPWGKEDQDLIAYHRELIRIHKENPACRIGSGKIILALHGIIGMIRFTKNNQILVVVNNNEEGQKVSVPVWLGEVFDGFLMERLILSVEDGFSTERAHYLVSGGEIEIFMPPLSAAVLRTRQEAKTEEKQERHPEKGKKRRILRRWQHDSGNTWKHRNKS